MLAYQLLCHTYKKLYRQVYRVYIIGLRYRHDCDQFKYGIYAGAYEQEHATPLYSCHGVFIDRFIFRSNFPGMRLPWEYHDQSQETN